MEPKWEGEWTIARKKNAVNYEISDGVRNRIVHVNRLKQRIQPNVQRLHLQQDNQPVCQQWNPPSIDHIIESTDTPTPRYSTRNRRPPLFVMDSESRDEINLRGNVCNLIIYKYNIVLFHVCIIRNYLESIWY